MALWIIILLCKKVLFKCTNIAGRLRSVETELRAFQLSAAVTVYTKVANPY